MKIGDIVKGEITAIKPYGAFVKINNDYVGLVHISEFSNGFVRNIEDYVTTGDIIDLEVIELDGNKVSLSFKSLHKRKKRYKISLNAGFAPLKEKLSEWIDSYNMENDD